MNLIITDHCNRACPYCFAKSKMERNVVPEAGNDGHKYISLENVEWYLDFLKRSKVPVFKILGGEPTLHPKLPDIVSRGIERGFEVIVFTNGLWPDNALDYFKENGKERVVFIFNVNEPATQKDWENDRQRESLQVAGGRAMLGFNLYRENFDILFCRELINEFSLKREIRLGLASPIVRFRNSYLKPELLKQVGKRLANQLRELERSDILGAFDCGFPLCMFEDSDLGSLAKTTTRGFASICDSIIDVDPALNAWPCFPLGNLLNIHLRDYKDAAEVGLFFSKKLAPLRSLGSMDECISCRFLKRAQCSGGCLGHTIRAIEESGDSRLVEKLETRQ